MARSHQWLASIAATCVLVGCDGQADRTAGQPGTAPEAETSPLPLVDPPFDRRALLVAVAEAASAYGAGRIDQDFQNDLQGKRFTIRLRFGCPGDDMSSRGWTFDQQTRTARFTIDPDIGVGTRPIDAVNLTGLESAQGFSVERPWLYQAVCPARSGGTNSAPNREGESSNKSAGTTSAEPTVPPLIAIVQTFTKDDPRTHLGNDRPLSATVKLSEQEQPSLSGYDLILSGRFARARDGRVIACYGEGHDIRPSCVVFADFERVVLSSPDGETLADWSSG